ncbi:unnamed protein product [Schistocephalus solidus]|uniref:BAH domain-containing protein n=1 Tax=Schistocephalus solidus TaxID=70667 RepID=A0A183SIE2_SCHSO|nr:unnamed protein product [Schistocephalus solidus]
MQLLTPYYFPRDHNSPSSSVSSTTFSFPSPPDATSLDFVLLRCFASLNEEGKSVQGVDGHDRVHRLPSHHAAHNANSGGWRELSPANCPITIQLSTAGLPLSLLTSSSSTSATQSTSKLPQDKVQPLYENDAVVDLTTEPFLKRKLVGSTRVGRSASDLPGGKPPLKYAHGSVPSVVLKLGDLRAHDNVPNYLYLKNHQPTGKLLISYRWISRSDCPSVRGYNFFPPRNETKEEDNYEDSTRISLLPWLNDSWVELTPRYSRKARTTVAVVDAALRSTAETGMGKDEVAFQPVAVHSSTAADTDELVLPRCATWSPLSRSDLSLPFAFQFSYQAIKERPTLNWRCLVQNSNACTCNALSYCSFRCLSDFVEDGGGGGGDEDDDGGGGDEDDYYYYSDDGDDEEEEDEDYY